MEGTKTVNNEVEMPLAAAQIGQQYGTASSTPSHVSMPLGAYFANNNQGVGHQPYVIRNIGAQPRSSVCCRVFLQVAVFFSLFCTIVLWIVGMATPDWVEYYTGPYWCPSCENHRHGIWNSPASTPIAHAARAFSIFYLVGLLRTIRVLYVRCCPTTKMFSELGVRGMMHPRGLFLWTAIPTLVFGIISVTCGTIMFTTNNNIFVGASGALGIASVCQYFTFVVLPGAFVGTPAVEVGHKVQLELLKLRERLFVAQVALHYDPMSTSRYGNIEYLRMRIASKEAELQHALTMSPSIVDLTRPQTVPNTPHNRS